MTRWIVLVALAGCGARPTPSSPGEPGEPFSVQAARGAELYGEHCASCHGDQGEGREGPRLVGLAQGALPLDPPPGRSVRTARFRTAADVAGFVVANMPPGAGGSLGEANYLRILAFSLKANGVDLGARHLDIEVARSLVLWPEQ